MALMKNEAVEVVKKGSESEINLSGQIWKPAELSLMRKTFVDIVNTSKPPLKSLILEMESLSFMSSRGIGYIAELYSNVKNIGGELYISNPQAHILELLELSELHTILNIIKR